LTGTNRASGKQAEAQRTHGEESVAEKAVLQERLFANIHGPSL
jgi:hypothetical protein